MSGGGWKTRKAVTFRLILAVEVSGHDEAKLELTCQFFQEFRRRSPDRPRIDRNPVGSLVTTRLSFDVWGNQPQRMNTLIQQLEAASTELGKKDIPACVMLSQDDKHQILAQNPLWAGSGE